MMEYTSEFDEADGICRVRIRGEFSRPADSTVLKHFAIDCHDRNGCILFLFDMTRAEFRGGTLSLFEAANPQESLASHLRRFRTAVVCRELTEDDRFFENVAINRGFQWQAFDSVEGAEDWLRQRG